MRSFTTSDILQIVQRVAPGGKITAGEYISLNPRRADKTAGSFRINLTTQAWSDFATGDKGGSIVSYATYCMGITDRETFKWLDENKFGRDDDKTAAPAEKPVKPTNPNEIQFPEIPEDFPKPPDSHFKHGKPDETYYYSAGIVMRFNAKEGQPKSFSVLTPWLINQKPEWKWKGFADPKPLYNVDKLNPDLPIIIVEGEKTVHSGEIISKKYNFITWPGGSGGVKKADWAQLGQGKRCFIIPDNDEPGSKSAQYIQEQVNGLLCRVPTGKPEGWDIADGCTEEELEQILKSSETTISTSELPFQVLGFTNPPYTVIYRRRDNCEIVPIAFKNHKKEELLALASAAYWTTFCGGEKINAFFIQSVLAEMAHKAGRFNGEKVRGYGAWTDDNRAIYNNGETIADIPINKFETKYYYRYGKRITGDIKEQLFPELIDIFGLLGFSTSDQMLLMGWCCIAPICGCLTWRPHVWITADHGSGKSTILQQIVKPLIGKALFCVSNTSEAGLRQELGNNSFPVMFDEAEGKTKQSMDNMSRIIELARKSSGNMSGHTFKGTPGGRSFTYTIQSSFCFSSINPPIEEAADESRITELEYHRLDVDKWHILHQSIIKTITPERCEALRVNTINHIDTILASIEVVRKVLSSHSENSRLSDQYSPMIAGAWHVGHNDIIDEENAKTMIDMAFDGKSKQEIREGKEIIPDSQQCLTDIMTIGISVGGGKIMSVGTLINQFCDISNIGIENNQAILNVYGIGITSDRSAVCIHERNTEFRRLLERTPWRSGISKVLKRLQGVQVGYKTSIQGQGCSTVKIPIERIIVT
jgi:putative DNA primase/helicase